jgi:methyl-accepting chemotaxis protein
MKLLLKFNLVFLLIFLLGLAATGYISWTLLHQHAREEISQNARLLMQAANAARAYTSTQVSPLLETQMRYDFLPQSVPAYSATEMFVHLNKQYPEYSYKEATLNPTNPRDRPVAWEADVIEKFRVGSTATEFTSERDTPAGRSLFVARPIQIKNAACLRCHSTPDAAPKTMIERYGSANGFGWHLNEVVGVQIISVPTEVPLARAREAFKVFMLSITGIFIAIGVALNLMLRQMVVRPITKLAGLADRVSMGEMDAPEFKSQSKDEIGTLTKSFNRMRKGLAQAMKMLDT